VKFIIKKDGSGKVAVGIESEEVAKCLDSDDSAGDRIVLGNRTKVSNQSATQR